MKTIPFCCPAKHGRRVLAEPHNLAKIFRAIPRASEAAIRGRDSSGRIAAGDAIAIADATIVAVAADRSAAALAEDALVRVSNAEALEVRTVIRAATRARRAVRNSFPKC